MRVEDHDDHKEIFLTRLEALELCKLGQGEDTCVWLAVGANGLECLYFNRGGITLTGETLEERWKAGKTVAKRDGCVKIKEIPG